MTAKTYSCPKCGAAIPQKEFLNRRDKVVCTVCGKTLIRWQVIQRQDAAKPLGHSLGGRIVARVLAQSRKSMEGGLFVRVINEFSPNSPSGQSKTRRRCMFYGTMATKSLGVR